MERKQVEKIGTQLQMCGISYGKGWATQRTEPRSREGSQEPRRRIGSGPPRMDWVCAPPKSISPTVGVLEVGPWEVIRFVSYHGGGEPILVPVSFSGVKMPELSLSVCLVSVQWKRSYLQIRNIDSASALILDFHSLELWEITVCCLSPQPMKTPQSSLW